MESPQISTQRLDHLGIVAGICQQIDLIGQIDAQTGSMERKVSVGQAVQAMVINALGFVSRPLYLMPEFYSNKPLARLLGEGIEAADLNDDSLGRALDWLYRSGVTEVFAAVSAHALAVFGIKTRFAHLDRHSAPSFLYLFTYPQRCGGMSRTEKWARGRFCRRVEER